MPALETVTVPAEASGKMSLYQAFLAARREILVYKYLESEKLCRDIGFEAALTGWLKHLPEWRKAHGFMTEEDPDLVDSPR